jgi:pyruvate,orthophosphate dikinase
MFMAQDRLPVMQDMVVASTLEERLEALKKLEEMQEEDFYGIFDAMDGLPVTVRLLDPPLHEFLPKLPDLDKELKNLPEGSPEAEAVKITTARVHELHEANPMLGFRGCRLGIIYPEIYEMQVRAIFKAACRLVKEGKHPVPDIMIPLVATKEEMRILRVMVDSIAPVIMKEYGCQVEYMVGTMIELPRAAMVADQLAQHAQFFSFGTNDLTQTTFGYSRDDAEGKFLGQYVAEGILPQNPFAVLDRDGVGGLMEIGVAGGRKVNPSIQLGICGEHGGNPLSVAFCHKLGLNYVSCSPFRVPVSRLAAAHSALGLIK